MTTTVTTSAAPARWADRTGRTLLALCSVATLGAFAGSIAIVADTPDDYLLTEAWRGLAYLVFAGLWLMLAIAPRRAPGVWELIFVHKIGITLFAVAAYDVPHAPRHVVVDGLLVLATAAAYVLCRGWRSWRRPSAADELRPVAKLPA